MLTCILLLFTVYSYVYCMHVIPHAVHSQQFPHFVVASAAYTQNCYTNNIANKIVSLYNSSYSDETECDRILETNHLHTRYT